MTKKRVVHEGLLDTAIRKLIVVNRRLHSTPRSALGSMTVMAILRQLTSQGWSFKRMSLYT